MKLIIPIIIIIGLFLVFTTSKMNSPNISESKEIPPTAKEAIFAGGCFWCNEAAFEGFEGVFEVTSGYTGGHKENPTYYEVTTGETGHKEAVKVIYDPSIITYKELVEKFWRQIDPTDNDGQFVDSGSQYRTAIYYKTEEEKQIAEQSKKELGESGRFDKPIVTEILPAVIFYDAEEEHQDYYKKRVLQYKAYEAGSGRKQFKEVWEE